MSFFFSSFNFSLSSCPSCICHHLPFFPPVSSQVRSSCDISEVTVKSYDIRIDSRHESWVEGFGVFLQFMQSAPCCLDAGFGRPLQERLKLLDEPKALALMFFFIEFSWAKSSYWLLLYCLLHFVASCRPSGSLCRSQAQHVETAVSEYLRWSVLITLISPFQRVAHTLEWPSLGTNWQLNPFWDNTKSSCQRLYPSGLVLHWVHPVDRWSMALVEGDG